MVIRYQNVQKKKVPRADCIHYEMSFKSLAKRVTWYKFEGDKSVVGKNAQESGKKGGFLRNFCMYLPDFLVDKN